MDDIIFWLIILAFPLLQRLLGKKRAADARKRQLPGQATRPGSPRPGISRPAKARAQEPQPPSDFDQAIAELRNALGFSTPPSSAQSPTPEVPDREAFGASEERFEAEPVYRSSRPGLEEQFESRRRSFVREDDLEEAFERTDTPGAGFLDDTFEAKPAASEVSFRNAWRGHESDFEFHSSLEHDVAKVPSRLVEPAVEAAIRKTHEPSPLKGRLQKLSDLQQAVLMHELFGRPVSLRPRSARRRPF
jgi:hypothetical protein